MQVTQSKNWLNAVQKIFFEQHSGSKHLQKNVCKGSSRQTEPSSSETQSVVLDSDWKVSSLTLQDYCCHSYSDKHDLHGGHFVRISRLWKSQPLLIHWFDRQEDKRHQRWRCSKASGASNVSFTVWSFWTQNQNRISDNVAGCGNSALTVCGPSVLPWCLHIDDFSLQLGPTCRWHNTDSEPRGPRGGEASHAATLWVEAVQSESSESQWASSMSTGCCEATGEECPAVRAQRFPLGPKEREGGGPLYHSSQRAAELWSRGHRAWERKDTSSFISGWL